MRLEQLPRERWGELSEDFREFTDEMPDDSAEIYVLVDDEIVAWFIVETVKHVGPLFVKEEYRGKGVGTLLAHHAMQLMRGKEFYVACLSEQTEGMCQRSGLQKVEGTLWVK